MGWWWCRHNATMDTCYNVHACGGQRIIYKNCFPSFTVWVLGVLQTLQTQQQTISLIPFSFKFNLIESWKDREEILFVPHPYFSQYQLLRYNVKHRTLACEDLGKHHQALESDVPVIEQRTHRILVPCSYLDVLLVTLHSSLAHLRPTSKNT